MSRPSQAESARLEALETASTHLYDAMQSCGVLAAHLRRLNRRVPQLSQIVELADREMARIIDDCDQAHDCVKQVLQSDQAERSAGHP